MLPLLLSTVVAVGCGASTTTSAPSESAETATAAADSEASTTTEATDDTALAAVFVEDEVAIAGADPVAYFTEEAYVPGSAEFTHEWSGATWQFASAENRDEFASNPEQYAPQYGGFCAWAVSQGKTAPIEPEAWKIVDGKLYLNYDARIQERWAQDIPGNIAKADSNWPGVVQQ
ncbi:MAG: YHS domain-containing (seleno)protein [Cyanobacteria bacterium P01_C01_bin.70]